MKLTVQSIKRPAGTIMLMIVVMALGVAGFFRLPTNMLPDITYPMVKVYVYWPGATPEQIENEIASVVERKMATVDNLDYIESTSEEGVYTLLVNFDYSVNRDIAYQDVLAKMGLIKKELPQGILEPVIFKADPSQLPVVEILVSSENMSLTQREINEEVAKFLKLQAEHVKELQKPEQEKVRVIPKRNLKKETDPQKLQIQEKMQKITSDVGLSRLIKNTTDK